MKDVYWTRMFLPFSSAAVVWNTFHCVKYWGSFTRCGLKNARSLHM